MVGYGPNYSLQVHHRASSIVSYKEDSPLFSCRGGYATWFDHQGNDLNVLVGALVGGLDHNDNFADERDDYEKTKLATYNNGLVVGILARLQGGNDGDNQLLPGIIFLKDEINLVSVCFDHVDGDAFNGCSTGSHCA